MDRIVTVAIVLAFAALPTDEAACGDEAATGRGTMTVGPNVQVSTPHADVPHAEVVLAAGAGEPARLLAGSILERPGGGDSVVVYSSPDGGKTWALALERKATKGGPRYLDPAIAFGPDGSAHVAYIGVSGEKTELGITSSPDGGKTWGAPVTKAEQPVDRPFLAVDRTSGEFRGRIYCGCQAVLGSPGKWKPAVFASRDGGKTFGAPTGMDLPRAVAALTCGPGAVLSDGTLVIPYGDRIPSGGARKAFGVWLRRSTTGADSFLDEQTVATRDFLGANTNAPYIPVLAADPGSKAFPDRLYVTWAEKTPAGMQVVLTLSRDRGVTWSRPVRLSEQGEPKEGSKGHHALLPSVAVNGAGVVGVSWYDTRDGREGKPACHVRFRASLDGGDTWLPSARVTDRASDFELNDRPGGVASRNWVGHTAGLAADAAGRFHPLWVDNRGGVKQVFTTAVTVKPK